jgi:hypothetical protein
LPYPCRTNTAITKPSGGTTTANHVSCLEAKSIPALSTKVTATTTNPPTDPPSSAPRPAMPMLDQRARPEDPEDPEDSEDSEDSDDPLCGIAAPRG